MSTSLRLRDWVSEHWASERWASQCRGLLLLVPVIAAALACSQLDAQVTPFRRGDANTDGVVGLLDGLTHLNALFSNAPTPPCEDARDSDDDGALGLGDAIFTLSFVFRNGLIPPLPGPFDCGWDPTADELGCEQYYPGRPQRGCLARSSEALFDFRQFPLLEVRTQAMALRDLDADGDLDLVVGHGSNAQRTFSVLLGDGDGGFSTLMRYGERSFGVSSLFVEDVDGDGTLDVVGSSEHSGALPIMSGNGDGTFERPRRLSIWPVNAIEGDLMAHSIDLEDLDANGLPDIVAVGQDKEAGLSSMVAVVLNGGEGNFAPPTIYTTEEGAWDVVTGDFDEDGRPDAIVSHGEGLTLLRNRGDGVLESGGSFRFEQLFDIHAEDFDKDGSLDVLAATRAQVVLIQGDGRGGFADTPSAVAPLFHSRAFDTVDLDGNGTMDLVLRGGSVLPGVGDGTFGPFRGHIGGPADALAFGDLDNDGTVDAVGGSEIHPYIHATFGLGNGSFRGVLGPDTGTFEFAYARALGDLDRDGDLDLVVLGLGEGGLLHVFSNSGDTFAVADSYDVNQGNPQSAASLTLGDIDGDGSLDIVSSGRGMTSALLNVGDGRFVVIEVFAEYLSRMELRDFDGDGFVDLVGLPVAETEVVMLRGRGDGHFESPETVAILNERRPKVGALAIGDFNGDGLPDFITSQSRSDVRGEIRLALGLGDGKFRFGSAELVNGSPVQVVAGDLDGDGIDDFVVFRCESGNNEPGGQAITAFLGTAEGKPSRRAEFVIGSVRTNACYEPVRKEEALSLGDVNGDAILDLTATSPAGLRLWLGRGDGTFESTLLLRRQTQGAILADVDGDGDTDLLNDVVYFNQRIR